MIILSNEKSLTGLAGTTGVIEFTIMGSKFTQYGDVPFTIAQGTLTTSDAEMYTPLPSETDKISSIILANTSALPVTGVTISLDGYQVSPALVIPASGSAIYEDGGWKVYTSTGELSTVTGGTSIGMYRATASVSDGDTIAHGFSAAPTAVIPAGSVSGEIVSVTAIGATTFTVAIKTPMQAPGTTQTIYWMALP